MSSITRLSVPVPAIGLCGEPGKIYPHSLPADLLLEFCDRFKGDGVLPSPGQGSEHHSGLQKGSFSGIVVRLGSGTALGSDVSFNAGGRPGPLHYRALQHLRNEELRVSQSFNSMVTLDREARMDLPGLRQIDASIIYRRCKLLISNLSAAKRLPLTSIPL